MASVKLNVNNKDYTVDADADTPLLWVLRDHLNILGPKFGCGVAQCGACTVHVDGDAKRSCVYPLSIAGNKKIVTIEGLSEDGMHVLQQAWVEMDVAQCGYCQAGQLMSAAVLLRENNNPTDEDIDNAMSGNICRCGTYVRIRKAIHLAAQKLNAK
ncbi:MAG: (2Fe-2S)-binding protein [Chitinophagaceae bacterium]